MIPYIPRNPSIIHGPAPAPPEPDPDGYPKRSVCEHCGDAMELTAEGAAWTVGYSTECSAAPNPDDGPMPGHVPGVVLHPPKR